MKHDCPGVLQLANDNFTEIIWLLLIIEQK